MYELKKLNEAKYFLKRMIEETNQIDHFIFNLSAFLSSSRSILQYALEELKTKQGGQKWYNQYMTNEAMFRFFKDKRDINIHKVR